MDDIIRTFNERCFQGWSATPEEQKIKFVNIAKSVRNHPDFKAKYQDNPDPYNKHLAFEKILDEVTLLRRKDDLAFYKLYAGDPAFKAALTQDLQRAVER